MYIKDILTRLLLIFSIVFMIVFAPSIMGAIVYGIFQKMPDENWNGCFRVWLSGLGGIICLWLGIALIEWILTGETNMFGDIN